MQISYQYSRFCSQWVSASAHGLGPGRDAGYVVFCSKIAPFAVTPKPTQKSHRLSVTSFYGFNTDAKCSNQIQILPKNRAHCEIRWKRVYYLVAGQELDEQCEYRDLLSIPFPSCPSDR